MKYGICTSPKNIPLVAKCGFDYIEALTADIVEADKQTLNEIITLCKDHDVSVKACNCLFPANIRLTGCNYSLDQIREYVKKVFYKASMLGIETFSLGSGFQRHVEPGDDFTSCVGQFKEMAAVVADEAAPYGMEIAIEPLNKNETNLINTVAEAAVIAAEINKPNLLILADTYHMYWENESIDILPQFQDRIAHVHIANPVGRKYPREDDGVDYKGMIAFLTNMGYNNKISVEANTDDFESDCVMCGKYFAKICQRMG